MKRYFPRDFTRLGGRLPRREPFLFNASSSPCSFSVPHAAIPPFITTFFAARRRFRVHATFLPGHELCVFVNLPAFDTLSFFSAPFPLGLLRRHRRGFEKAGFLEINIASTSFNAPHFPFSRAPIPGYGGRQFFFPSTAGFLAKSVTPY